MELRRAPADNRPSMPQDLAPLLDRIRMLADQQPSASPDRLLEQMEHTLTDGYALALSLESDALRLEKEIDAVVRAGGEGDGARLNRLAEERAAKEREARSLRAHLTSLRVRREAVRAATLAPG